MKTTIKTTALAILISLLSACKLTENSGSDTTDNTNKTQINNPTTPTETQVVVAEKTDKNGEEWRHITLFGRISTGKSKTAIYNTNGTLGAETTSLLTNNIYFNLDNEDFSQGINSGSLEYKDINFIKYKIGQGGNTNTTTNTLNYLVSNQPYSSYGVLFLSEDNTKFFTVGQKAGLEGDDSVEYIVGKLNGSDITWNDAVAGDATYKGEIIARVIRENENGEFVAESPKQDGNVVLNAHFENGNNKSYVSTTVDSNTLGKFQLGNVHMSSFDWIHGDITENLQKLKETQGYSDNATIVNNGYFSGYDVIDTKSDSRANVYYNGQFVGKDFNDVVGEMSIRNDKLTYEATFGGTKQK